MCNSWTKQQILLYPMLQNNSKRRRHAKYRTDKRTKNYDVGTNSDNGWRTSKQWEWANILSACWFFTRWQWVNQQTDFDNEGIIRYLLVWQVAVSWALAQRVVLVSGAAWGQQRLLVPSSPALQAHRLSRQYKCLYYICLLLLVNNNSTFTNTKNTTQHHVSIIHHQWSTSLLINNKPSNVIQFYSQ